MAKEILLPLLGDIMKAGTIAQWLKDDGAVVAAGEPLYVVETEKISFELESSASGRLSRVAAEGSTIPVGGLVGWLLEEGEAPPLVVHAVEERKDRSSAQTGPVTSKIIPLRGRRGVVAQRMLESLHTIAQLTITLEVEMAGVARLREELAQAGARVGHNAIMLKAAAMALRQHPLLNSTVRGEEIHLLDQINVGMAVDTPEGLMVPVVRNADQKGLQEIESTMAGLVERTRGGRLTLDDVAYGTFTVSSMGMYGIDVFTPIVNPPQVAILGIGRLNKRLALVEREVREVTTLYLSLSFDHRVVDGAPAAKFLRTIKSNLEHPSRFGAQAWRGGQEFGPSPNP